MIKIFRFPDNIAPTWPSARPPPAPIYAADTCPSPPRLNIKALSLGPPIFASNRIHPGMLCDQVMWADKCSTAIISKAGAPMVARQSPRLLVKVWQPLILDPNEGLAACSITSPLDVPRTTTHLGTQLAQLTFMVLKQIELQGRAFIGDGMGIYRDEKGPLLAIGTEESSLYIFDPDSHRQFLPHSRTSNQHFPSPPSSADYFPPDRPQFDYDFFPRVLPSYISDLGEAEVHFRSIVISPEGEYILAVGDGARLAIWKKGSRRYNHDTSIGA